MCSARTYATSLSLQESYATREAKCQEVSTSLEEAVTAKKELAEKLEASEAAARKSSKTKAPKCPPKQKCAKCDCSSSKKLISKASVRPL